MPQAVFLSYASQDAGAAGRICESLRAGGVEVWFDQDELRGGDAWDTKIKKQIRECTLFIPVISASTNARLEGYFRREWSLAVDRTRDMAEEKAFLFPVVIDGTSDAAASVPDKFRERQWTRLPGGETPPAFCARVRHLLGVELPPAAAPSRAPTGRTETPFPAAARRSLWPWVGAGLVVIAVGTILILRPSRPEPVALPPALKPPPVTVAEPKSDDASIAVLPFVDMSQTKDQEYFSDGLSEELLNLLTKLPQLRVIARTSSFSFKGKELEVADIARKLNVAHVLEGSVRKAGDRLRITVQLIRASDSSHLWSETYDRQLTDVFKVQDEIAGAVVAALKVKLLPAQQVTSGHRTANAEAYNQYLLGNQLFNRSNGDGYRRAVAAYQQAIALDPAYAAAYAGLAYAKAYAADYSETAAEYSATREGALAAAEKAITLAPDLADGYGARGWMRSSFAWNWNGAQADFEKGLALDPANSMVQRRYSKQLAFLGRLPEAIAVARKSIESDPLSAPNWENLGAFLTARGDYAEAIEALNRALAINPEDSYAHWYAGQADLQMGRATEALKMFPQAGEAFTEAGLAMAHYTLGHATESQQALDDLVAKYAHDSAYQVAQTYAWRGEKEKAFEWLQHAVEQRDGGLANIKIDPLVRSLRGDPRYAALLKKLGFPD